MRFTFTTGGLLSPTPNGEPYVCTLEDVRRTFVTELGAPDWRVRLFEGFELLRLAVGVQMPRTRWWLTPLSCFLSLHPEPLFGEAEDIRAVALVQAEEAPPSAQQFALFRRDLMAAKALHQVDASFVVLYPTTDPRHIETCEGLEFERSKARMGIADHATMEGVPAGFVEVLP